MQISFLSVMSLVPLGAGAFASACGKLEEKPSSQPLLVDHYIFDAAVKRSWAVMIDCRHPEWPAEMVEVQPSTVRTKQILRSEVPTLRPQLTSPSVASGSHVDLWRNGEVNIRLSGVATEAALFGEPIRVRVDVSGVFLRGIVRGPHSVELTENSKMDWREP
jgi:hypothetical protein